MSDEKRGSFPECRDQIGSQLQISKSLRIRLSVLLKRISDPQGSRIGWSIIDSTKYFTSDESMPRESAPPI